MTLAADDEVRDRALLKRGDLVAPAVYPPARRGISGPAPSRRVGTREGHPSRSHAAPVKERDDFRHNVLRDERGRHNGHGVTCSGPSTGASRRGAAHDPVSTNDGPTGGRGTRGGDGGLLRRGERERDEVVELFDLPLFGPPTLTLAPIGRGCVPPGATGATLTRPELLDLATFCPDTGPHHSPRTRGACRRPGELGHGPV